MLRLETEFKSLIRKEENSRKNYNKKFIWIMKKAKTLLNKRHWIKVKRKLLLSNSIIELCRNLEKIEHEASNQMYRRGMGTYSTYYVENLLGNFINSFLETRVKKYRALINAQIGSKTGPRPDITICRDVSDQKRTISKNNVLAIIEIKTGIGWNRTKSVTDFNKRVKNTLLKRVVKSKKQIFLILLEEPKNLQKLNSIEKSNIFVLSTKRFHNDTEIKNPIEPLFDRILKLKQ